MDNKGNIEKKYIVKFMESLKCVLYIGFITKENEKEMLWVSFPHFHTDNVDTIIDRLESLEILHNQLKKDNKPLYEICCWKNDDDLYVIFITKEEVFEFVKEYFNNYKKYINGTLPLKKEINAKTLSFIKKVNEQFSRYKGEK